MFTFIIFIFIIIEALFIYVIITDIDNLNNEISYEMDQLSFTFEEKIKELERQIELLTKEKNKNDRVQK